MILGYIYDTNNNLLDQVFDLENFECSIKLDGYDTANFFVDKYNKINHKLFNRIKIYEQIDGNERLYIDGVISARKPTLGGCTIYVKGYERILEKTFIDTDKIYNTTTQAVLENIVYELNKNYDRGITQAEQVFGERSGEFKAGTTIKAMIEQISKSGYEYKIIDKKIVMKEKLGNDYTQEPPQPVYLNTQYINADSTGKRIDTADFIDNDKLLVKTGTITQSNGRILHTGATNSFLSATNIIACNAEKTYFFKKVKFNSVTVAQVIIGQPFSTYVLCSVALLSNGKLQVELPGTGSGRILTSMNFVTNTEYDIVVKIKELNLATARVVTDADIFVNGVKQTVSFSSTGTNTNNPTGIQVGASNSTTNLLNGSREEIRVYSNYFDDQTCIAICGGADVRDDLVARWNGKIYLQNFQSSAENLVHLYNINQRENYIYPTDGRVMSFDFALNADGTNSPSSQYLLRTPFMYLHARATNNQLQFRFDDSTSAVIAGATVPNIANLGNGDRKRHHIVLTFWREGGNTRMQGYLDGVYILNGSRNNRNPYSAGPTDIILGSGNVKVKGLQFYKFFDPVAGGYGIDEKDLSRIIARKEPVYTPSLFKFLGYDMNEGTGTVVYDNSGNGRNATIAGGASRETDTIAPFVIIIDQTATPKKVFKLDARDNSDRNIDDFDMLIDGDLIFNAIFNGGYTVNNDSINEYGRLEYNMNSSGNITAEKQQMLNEQSMELVQTNVDITLDDFYDLNVGDQVMLYIYLGEDQDNVEGVARVIEKTYQNGITKIKLGENKIKSKNILEKIKENDERIKALENL